MARPWRVGQKLGRILYLDDRSVGRLDDPELARAVVDGLVLLDELGDVQAGNGWRARLIAWRLRVRALRLEAFRRRSRGARCASSPRKAASE